MSHVLSLQGVNTNTTFVDRFGMLFVKNVTSLLGLDVNVFMGTNTTSGSNSPAGLKSKYVSNSFFLNNLLIYFLMYVLFCYS